MSLAFVDRTEINLTIIYNAFLFTDSLHVRGQPWWQARQGGSGQAGRLLEALPVEAQSARGLETMPGSVSNSDDT